MKRYISVFIMDVSSSSSEDNWNEITDYLQEWENHLDIWCENIITAKVSHRRGDEILFVGDHCFSAYTIAHYMNLYWKFTEQRPYFGLSHGSVSENIEQLDIEIWNHPLIKQARSQNEKIKRDRDRKITMRFADELDSHAIISTADVLNLLVENQLVLQQNQSENQKLVYALYSIYREQKQIAGLLNKTPSTISTQFKRGRGELLQKNFDQIQKLLGLEEGSEAEDFNRIQLLISDLNASICTHLKKSVPSALLFKKRQIEKGK